MDNLKKKAFQCYLILANLIFSLTSAQVGINTTNPNALLQISSENPDSPKSTDGLLLPRLNTFPDNLSNNQDSMLIFLNEFNNGKSKGFYWWDNDENEWLKSGTNEINDLLDGKTNKSGESVFLGHYSGNNDYNGSINYSTKNVGLGYQTLYHNSFGYLNVAIGYQSLYNNKEDYNSSIGYKSLYSNTYGLNNTSIGYVSLQDNTSGKDNVGIGAYALEKNINNNANVGLGVAALRFGTLGKRNTALGSSLSDTNGSENTAVGNFSQNKNYQGNRNTTLGIWSGFEKEVSNKLYIGDTVASSRDDPGIALIYGDFNEKKLGININNFTNKEVSAIKIVPDSKLADLFPIFKLYDLSNYSLFVKGGILTEMLTVTSSWADYVFEPDYNLIPLKSVKTFIDKNGHLPNVPSAKNIEESGLQVGDMMRIQQEKIEELTLYLIYQEQRRKKQKRQIAFLNKKILSIVE